MLTSAHNQLIEQQKISARGLREARRTATRGSVAVAAVIAAYQLESAANAFNHGPEILAEQGIDAPASGTARLSSVVTGAATIDMLDKAATAAAFDRLVLTLMQDASRTAGAIDIGRRPAVTGYVRSLRLPSCSRCALLAGRVYRYSTGFQRHPNCDCIMTPTTQAQGQDLVLDPSDAIESGQITGLSKGDLYALGNGADLGRVVNTRRDAAGLRVGSSVVTRAGGRLTPEGILQRATTRDEAVSLLRQHGYIR